MAGRFSQILAAALLTLCATLGTACASHSPEDPDEVEAYRQDLQDSAETADSLLQESRDGHNVSSFGLGMYAMTLLNELSVRDQDLSRHIHRDGRSTDLYLREVFQAHPAQEVMAVRSMADKGHRTTRLAAEHLLEALRHIPSRSDPIAAQERERSDLTAELVALKSLLSRAAAEAVPTTAAVP